MRRLLNSLSPFPKMSKSILYRRILILSKCTDGKKIANDFFVLKRRKLRQASKDNATSINGFTAVFTSGPGAL